MRWITYVGNGTLSLFFYALPVFLAARNSIHTWWIGIIGCVLYGWVFFTAKLYADVTLQVFFIFSSGMGWFHWLKGNRGNEIAITRIPCLYFVVMLITAIIVASGYAVILHIYTDAWSPWLDSLILTCSMLAQFMLMGRRLENWYIWLLVNTIAVPLYASRGLWITSFLYVIFWCNAWYGLFSWRRELAKS